MIATLRESKAKLSKLVERAAGGEEVLITVRGKPRARLAGIARSDMAAWAEELRAVQGGQTIAADSCEVLDAIREERG